MNLTYVESRHSRIGHSQSLNKKKISYNYKKLKKVNQKMEAKVNTLKEKLEEFANTPLRKAVVKEITENSADYSDSEIEGLRVWLEDLNQNGCVSGMVGGLVYYADTLKFYTDYKDEINELLKELMENSGFKSPFELFGDKWDSADPLAFGQLNQNLLAWFGFEETASKLYQEIFESKDEDSEDSEDEDS